MDIDVVSDGADGLSMSCTEGNDEFTDKPNHPHTGSAAVRETDTDARFWKDNLRIDAVTGHGIADNGVEDSYYIMIIRRSAGWVETWDGDSETLFGGCSRKLQQGVADSQRQSCKRLKPNPCIWRSTVNNELNVLDGTENMRIPLRLLQRDNITRSNDSSACCNENIAPLSSHYFIGRNIGNENDKLEEIILLYSADIIVTETLIHPTCTIQK